MSTVRSLAVSLAVVVASAACGSSPSIAPPPFSAEQIRAATDPGRTYVFRVGQGGSVAAIRTLTFTRSGERVTRIHAVMTSPDGEVLGPASDEEVTWDELVGHASWPAAATTISEDRVEVPAGTFDAMLYTVRTTTEEGDESVIRAWFARSLPGAPVRFEQSSGGEVQFLMELLEHRAGTRQPR